MHISLDSAIGQQRRLNQVGETISSIAAPAAAYSLRSLTGGDPRVVRVRREGDNGEQDFTVSEINSGALVDYINTNGVFANTGYESFSNASASGFTASNTGSLGYAVSDLPDGTSGTAISVSFDISITNGSPSISLRDALNGGNRVSNFETYTTSGSKTITLTATGSYAGVGFTEGDAPSNFTVSNFKILGDGFVETWYDQSGNGNDFTQTTSGSQPKIVSSGSLLSDGIFFDGSNDKLTTSALYATNLSVFSAVKNDTSVRTANYMRFIYIAGSSNSFQMVRGGHSDIGKYLSKNTSFQASTAAFEHGTANGTQLLSAITTSSATTAFIDGSSQSNSSELLGAGNNTTTTLGARDDSLSSSFFEGSMREVIIYQSNETDNRVALETNINSHYSIF